MQKENHGEPPSFTTPSLSEYLGNFARYSVTRCRFELGSPLAPMFRSVRGLSVHFPFRVGLASGCALGRLGKNGMVCSPHFVAARCSGALLFWSVRVTCNCPFCAYLSGSFRRTEKSTLPSVVHHTERGRLALFLKRVLF